MARTNCSPNHLAGFATSVAKVSSPHEFTKKRKIQVNMARRRREQFSISLTSLQEQKSYRFEARHIPSPPLFRTQIERSRGFGRTHFKPKGKDGLHLVKARSVA